MPAIVYMQSFKYEWNIGGYDFYSYMERPDAFEPKLHESQGDMYYDYLDYMKNDEKSDGIFNAEKDHLSQKEIDKYRSLEMVSQMRGCPKYLGVISFENDFLKENGVMTPDGRLDRSRLKDYARNGINALIDKSKKLNANNVYWTAAIHENTDNIHIHYQLCEYCRLEDRKKLYKDKDMLELSAFEALKSKMVNQISPQTERLKRITQLERGIVHADMSLGFSRCEQKILELYCKLPSGKQWQYNRPKMKPFKAEIDNVVRSIIESDEKLSAQYKAFEKELKEYDEYNLYLYGKRKDIPTRERNASFNRRRDFYSRAGNALLNQLKKLDFEQPAAPNLSGERNAQPDEVDVMSDYLPPEYFEAENYLEPPPEDYDEHNMLVPPDEPLMEQVDDEYYEQPTAAPYLSGKEDTNFVMQWSGQYKTACKLMYDYKSEIVDYEKAERLLLYEAQRGNVLAIHDLGKLYATDKLGKADEEKSNAYYAQALQGFIEIEPAMSDKMQPYVQYRIGKMYCYGTGTEQDYGKAFEWFEKSAQQGNKFAQHSLANLYYYGSGVNKDYAQAYVWYSKAAAQGQPYAAYAVAQMHSRGESVEKNDNAAQGYYKQALSGFLELDKKNQSDDNLLYKIGNMYLNGLGCDKDYDTAERYLLRAAKIGNTRAEYALGKLYMTEDKLNLDKAEEYLLKAATHDDEQGFIDYALGKLYLTTEKLDLNKAESALISAADKGNQYAAYKLGKLYQTEDKLDLGRAEQYLLRAAALGDEQGLADYALGKLYMNKDKPDMVKAEKHLIISADKNNMYAQYALGKLYQTDEKKDLRRAETYLLRAAAHNDEQGLADYALGKLYMNVDKPDMVKAEKHLILSANKNNSYAQFAMGILKYHQLNKTEAREWLQRSANNGNEYAAEILKNISKPRAVSVRRKKYDRPKAHYINYQLHSMLNQLRYDYERHLKELQREYEYEQEKSNDEKDYDYIEESITR